MTEAMEARREATATFRAARDYLLAHREDYDRPRAVSAGRRWTTSTGRSTIRRRRAGNDRPGAAHRRGGRQRGRAVRSPSCPSARTGSPTACARSGVRPRRPHAADARQRGRALGDHPRRDEARRRRHPRHAAARPRRSADRVERGRVAPRRRRRPPTPRSSTTCPATTRGSPSAADAPGWQHYADATPQPTAFEPDGATQRRRPAAALLHVGHDGAAEAGAAHARELSGRPPLDDVLDRSAAGRRPPATSARPAGPSTRGAASSRPWNAEATVFIFNYARFDAAALLDALARSGVTTLCAPPTVWRMLIQETCGATGRAARGRRRRRAAQPRSDRAGAASVGRSTIRDGYGQTETTAQIGNTPGQPLKPGSMGRPLPGLPRSRCSIRGRARRRDEGEICHRPSAAPLGLMAGYADDAERTAAAMRGGYYHTGDIATPRRRRLPHVRRPHRRRVQGVRLPDQPVRARERADRARGGRRGGRGARARIRCGTRCPKAFVALAPGYAPDRDTRCAILRVPENARPVTNDPRLEFADCRRRSQGRSAELSCATRRTSATAAPSTRRCARPTSSTKPTSRSSSARVGS